MSDNLITMDELLADLQQLLEHENILWTEIHLPLTWKVFKNKESLHVIVKIDIEYDDNQLAIVVEETIKNKVQLNNKIASYLRWARNN